MSCVSKTTEDAYHWRCNDDRVEGYIDHRCCNDRRVVVCWPRTKGKSASRDADPKATSASASRCRWWTNCTGWYTNSPWTKRRPGDARAAAHILGVRQSRAPRSPRRWIPTGWPRQRSRAQCNRSNSWATSLLFSKSCYCWVKMSSLSMLPFVVSG